MLEGLIELIIPNIIIFVAILLIVIAYLVVIIPSIYISVILEKIGIGNNEKPERLIGIVFWCITISLLMYLIVNYNMFNIVLKMGKGIIFYFGFGVACIALFGGVCMGISFLLTKIGIVDQRKKIHVIILIYIIFILLPHIFD